MRPPDYLMRLLHFPKPMSRMLRLRLKEEDRMCVDFYDEIRALAFEGRLNAVIIKVANEGKRGRVQAAVAKYMGLITGASDYAVLTERWGGVMEFKAKSGKLSGPQKDFFLWCDSQGVRRATCYSKHAGITFLEEWEAIVK